MKYSIIIEKGRESGFVAFCPALRGCVSQGVTKRGAIKGLYCLVNGGSFTCAYQGREIDELVKL